MPKCEWCGEKFDQEIAEDYFEQDFGLLGLSYNCFKPKLCFNCACEAIEEGADGVYFDDCEECGTLFDLAEEESSFQSHFSDCNGTTLIDCWNTTKMILCADCAMNYV